MASLDGLRAISILLVMLGHLSGTKGFGTLDLGIGDYARLGVVVFFVISGFLITSLLISEHDANGSISLKLFYARRSLRIFPASYTYLAIVSLLWLAGFIHLKPSDLWHSFTYTLNYLPVRSWQVTHLWSLSVEEQFYLLWPFTFAALGSRKGTWAAVGVILFGICARIGDRIFLIDTPYHNQPWFPMVADSLAMGCVLARLRGWLEQQRWYLRLFRPGYSLLLLAAILLVFRYRDYTVVSVFGTTVAYLCLAVLIHRSVYHANDWLGWILNWPPVAFVGVLSYSLYLWQQLFLNRSSGAWVNAFPQNIVFAAAAALASYFVVEKPLLGLRHRLRVRSVHHDAKQNGPVVGPSPWTAPDAPVRPSLRSPPPAN